MSEQEYGYTRRLTQCVLGEHGRHEQIVFLLASVCLCFKRRDEDVLPHIGFVSKVKIHAEG